MSSRLLLTMLVVALFVLCIASAVVPMLAHVGAALAIVPR